MIEIKIDDFSKVFCNQYEYVDGYCIGCLQQEEGLFLIDENSKTAKKLPDIYQKTPSMIYHYCGGYTHGLIMVSLLGEDLDLAYHHNFGSCAGIWGWIDKDFNEVIKPQYIFAENFIDGKALVCKGEWNELDNGSLAWDKEEWGVIDTTGKEIIKCCYDELYHIEDSNLYLGHKGGWENGNYCIIDLQTQEEILQLDFDFDAGYMFNSIIIKDNLIIFDEHFPGKEKEKLYVYDMESKEYLCKGKVLSGRKLNGKNKIVVNNDGKKIIVF